MRSSSESSCSRRNGSAQSNAESAIGPLSSDSKKCCDSILVGAVAYGRMMVAFGDDHKAPVTKGTHQRLGRADQMVLGATHDKDRLRQGVQLLGRENLPRPPYA